MLQGSRSSVVRALTAKVGGLGFDSQWLPKHFYPDLPPVAYHQLLPTVVVNKIIMYMYVSVWIITVGHQTFAEQQMLMADR